MDADPRFNEYPTNEEFVEGSEWTPGRIPPKIHSPEYSGNISDTSIDTQVARTIQAVSVTADPEPGGAVASTSAGQDTREVELTPLPGLTQQFGIQVEREIQKQIQECSRQILPKAEQPHVWNSHQRRKCEGVAPAHGEKSSQSVASPVVLSPLGTFPKLEAGSPTRPDLNLQVSRRLRHLLQS